MGVKRMKCPYCKSEGRIIDEKDGSGECTNPKCGGYFNLKPVWEMNKDWMVEK